MTSEEFRAIRLSLGLTQAELGRIMGMRASDISRIERERPPTIQQAAFIRYIERTTMHEAYKSDEALCKWLVENSSGDYRLAAYAADRISLLNAYFQCLENEIEELGCLIRALGEETKDLAETLEFHGIPLRDPQKTALAISSFDEWQSVNEK